jgi:phosphopantothenoylcysteine decarboxylase/phosphopantothenate--cysteine ligase
MNKILVIITGSVAIYKAVEVVRLLKKQGHEISCIMTKSATELIQPLLFATISGNPVRVDTFEERSDAKVGHILATREADFVLVVPSTANIIGKMANGIADDLASTTLMASNKPIIMAPAMNSVMWESKAFQRNLKQIKQDGVHVIEPQDGCLACGEEGKGKMESPEKIVEYLEKFLKTKKK